MTTWKTHFDFKKSFVWMTTSKIYCDFKKRFRMNDDMENIL